MGRLYPPIINGTIPAFCGTTLVVPFSINKAVSKSEIHGMMLKIKTVSGEVKETIEADAYDILSEYVATFSIDKSKYSIGQYYKIQIAFIDEDGTVGHYSSIGVGKYTTKPTVSIEKLSFGSINSHNYYYTGLYSQKGKDATEKMYSSHFNVYNADGEIIKRSEEVLHNTTTDVERYEATEEFKLVEDLALEQSFYIQFCVTTANGMKANSPKYRVVQRRSVKPEIQVELDATLNEDNGFITLTFNTDEEVILGTFLVSRASSLNGWVYEEFRRFNLQSIVPESWSMLDCTIEHGAQYKYSIQQYNENGIYSERIESNVVQAKFEDSFLYDGNRQLCIKFNPKVASFKQDLSEQKTETIGSKHPYIIRNGNVGYKEFSIGGLISYMMDESEQMFMTLDELGLAVPTTDLTYENILAERTFKLSVLDWLTDGKAKVFRSPTEGNYIVRLMNVSMSPTDSLGRMLHTFTATAYEIAEFNAENLEYYGLIDPTENIKSQTRWASVHLSDYLSEYKTTDDPVKIPINSNRYAYSIQAVDLMPGSIIYLDSEPIMIGATGAFQADSLNPIHHIYVDSRFIGQGTITYSYQTKAISVFGTVMDITIQDVPVKQFIGTNYLTSGLKNNVIDYLRDVRTEVLHLSMARFEKRHIIDIFVDINPEDFEDFDTEFNPIENEYKYYFDMDCKGTVADSSSTEELYLYRIRLRRNDYRGFKGENIFIDTNSTVYAPYTNYIVDGGTWNIFEYSEDLFNVKIDDEIINLFEIEKYEVSIPEQIKTIVPSAGVLTEVGYSKQIITYTFDNLDDRVEEAKVAYLLALANYDAARTDGEKYTPADVASRYDILTVAYKTYVTTLQQVIDEYKEAYGIQ